MEVSQLALAEMLICCFIGGVALAFFYELVQFPIVLLCSDLHRVPQAVANRLKVPGRLRFLLRKRTSRSSLRHRFLGASRVVQTVLRFFVDVFFCLVLATLLLLILYATNDGAFRFSAPVCLLGGFFACLVTLAPRCLVGIECVYVSLRAIFCWVMALLAYFPLRLGRLLWYRTAPIRTALTRRYRAWVDRRERKREEKRKKQTDAKERRRRPDAKNDEGTAFPRSYPTPDGKHVFYTGTSHIQSK